MSIHSVSAPLLTAFLALAHLASAAAPDPLTGHDFDFTLTYPSGFQISTSNPPSTILSPDEITHLVPQVTLTNHSSNSSDRYIAFLEITLIPNIETTTVISTFQWILANLTVLPDGVLGAITPDVHRINRLAGQLSSEVRNATAHVWLQNAALGKWINGDLDNTAVLWGVGMVWGNHTQDGTENGFLRASVDFKVRNETGMDRDDVDDNGARIWRTTSSSVVSATATPTTAAEGSSSATTTTTPNAAASSPFDFRPWVLALPGYLLLTGALLTI